MNAVSQKVLNWLYSVLTSDYVDVNRTYDAVARTLSQYPSLSPRTDVYTFENGSSALLLVLSGTLPVSFRGTTYQFPISLWVPHTYPQEPPMVYVTPAPQMVLRPGQHVGTDGRVYHPYLARWRDFWDKSSVLDLLAVLVGVFAKEPPVLSNVEQPPPDPGNRQIPPPLPPFPPELGRPSARNPQSPDDRARDSSRQPPPPPPKPHARDGNSVAGESLVVPPPLPPLPASHRTLPPSIPLNEHAYNNTAYSASQPYGASFSNRPPSLGSPQIAQSPPPASNGPPSYQANPSSIPQVSAGPPLYGGVNFPHTQWSHSAPTHSHSVQHSTPVGPGAKETEDLLSGPITLPVASQPSNATQNPPPIPPNPEKDALLHALGTTLHQHRVAAQTQAATSTIPSLLAQRRALQNAQIAMQSEMEVLGQLCTSLQSNERILAETIQRADGVMQEAKDRTAPNIDDVLVAPTVVGGQLYDVVAEEQALSDTMFVLGRALDRGRVGLDVFLKQSRSLAREQFLKKALIKKISRGMGLLE